MDPQDSFPITLPRPFGHLLIPDPTPFAPLGALCLDNWLLLKIQIYFFGSFCYLKICISYDLDSCQWNGPLALVVCKEMDLWLLGQLHMLLLITISITNHEQSCSCSQNPALRIIHTNCFSSRFDGKYIIHYAGCLWQVCQEHIIFELLVLMHKLITRST